MKKQVTIPTTLLLDLSLNTVLCAGFFLRDGLACLAKGHPVLASIAGFCVVLNVVELFQLRRLGKDAVNGSP